MITVRMNRLLTVLAACALSVAALSGCSSSSSESASSPSASPAQTSAAPTSAAPSPYSDLCSEEAILAALPQGSELDDYDCVNVDGIEWAAARVDPGPTVFFLEDVSGSWNVHTSDEICGTASAGFPPELLDYCSGT